jgi:hypothetical protein
VSAWTANESGPACSCGELTVVKILPDGQPVLLCLFHTREAGAVTRLPADRPECFQPCDPDCEAGPAHCEWVHSPARKPGWHSRDDCPVRTAA